MDLKPSMKLNFAQNLIKTKISSPQICCDGHSIGNLISENNSRGFMVEHFIKPPVTIDVEFMCNVFIHDVIINTRIGTQKSKGIELLVNDTTVCKCYLEPEQDIVQFTRFNAPSFTNKTAHVTSSCAVSDFYSGAHRHINSTNKITIRVFKTEASSLVAIRSLEINASINKRSNDRRVVTDFMKLIREQHKTRVRDVRDQACEALPRVADEEMNTSDVTGNFDEMPEDFLDPITHEFMTNPLILPSGKIIDKCTLEKYLENEFKWNRLPNDPYTHVKFNTNSKPIPAVQLKSRIDKFLLANRNDPNFEKLPRTFQGGAKNNENLLFKLIGKRRSSGMRKNCDEIQVMNDIDHVLDENVTKNQYTKRRKLDSNDEFGEILFQNSELIREYCSGKTVTVRESPRKATQILYSTIDLTEDNDKPVTNMAEKTKIKNIISAESSRGSGHFDRKHCEQDECSLEEQIQNTLKHYRTFTHNKRRDEVAADDDVDGGGGKSVQNHSTSYHNRSSNDKLCSQCTSSHLLYKIIKCDHYICRSCLLLCKNQAECKHCKCNFNCNLDVIRIYSE